MCKHDYYTFRTTRDMLEEIWNFTIICTSNMATLECSVDEGFAPALDSLETTYCTFNNTMNETIERGKCELYHRVYYLGMKAKTTTAVITNI